jgi:hypothetical protein
MIRKSGYRFSEKIMLGPGARPPLLHVGLEAGRHASAELVDGANKPLVYVGVHRSSASGLKKSRRQPWRGEANSHRSSNLNTAMLRKRRSLSQYACDRGA